MNIDVVEWAWQSAIIILGYAGGAATGTLLLRLVRFPLRADSPTLLILILPLLSTLVLEFVTGRWMNTPGSLGLGGLVVFLPMLIAGGTIVLVAFAAQQAWGSVVTRCSRDGQAHRIGRLATAGACSVFSVALWRYWPEPVARLF